MNIGDELCDNLIIKSMRVEFVRHFIKVGRVIYKAHNFSDIFYIIGGCIGIFILYPIKTVTITRYEALDFRFCYGNFMVIKNFCIAKIAVSIKKRDIFLRFTKSILSTYVGLFFDLYNSAGYSNISAIFNSPVESNSDILHFIGLRCSRAWTV